MDRRAIYLSAFLFVLVLIAPAQAQLIEPTGGFYADTITVNVDLPANHSAQYTLDGYDPRTHGTTLDTTSIAIEHRSSEPSALATNENITIWPFTPPEQTPKATPLRVVEYDAQGEEVGEYTHTYFIGWSPEDFNVPVFSVVINPEYLDDYDIGMYIKGRIYDEAVADGRNPQSPFTDANWNSGDLRWPSHYEMYEDGELKISDVVRLQTSGRWSSALPMKSWKISYRYDKSEVSYPFFGESTTDPIKTVRFRSGSQDMDSGILMRDCLGMLIFEGTETEIMDCRNMVLFLNGEYWGSYNMREDTNDNRHYAYKYNVSRSDIALLEMDGIVDGGEPHDNQPYFELRDWLREPTTDLANPDHYARFISEVNPVSLIDYHTCHAFVNNMDFPNDHFFWRNTNPDTQVQGTPIDGRWQYHCKDLDQGMGLYSRPDGSHLPDYNRIADHLFTNDSWDGWHTLFIRKAFESPAFRQLFYERSEELLETHLTPERTAQVVNDYRDEKAFEIPRQSERWQRPSSAGSWHTGVDRVVDWLEQRHHYYSQHITQLQEQYPGNESGTPEQPPQPPPEEPELPPEQPPGEEACFARVADAPVSCVGGTITVDENGVCRTIRCEAGGEVLQALACDKSSAQYFELYRQERVGTSLDICVGDTCLDGWGFRRSDNYPICTEQEPTNGDVPPTNGGEEPPEEPGTSVNLRVADWYPKGTHVVLLCEEDGFEADEYRFTFGNGHSQTRSTGDVYHIYEQPGTYTASCRAQGDGMSEESSIELTLT